MNLLHREILQTTFQKSQNRFTIIPLDDVINFRAKLNFLLAKIVQLNNVFFFQLKEVKVYSLSL